MRWRFAAAVTALARSVSFLGFRPGLLLHLGHQLPEIVPAAQRVEVRLLQFVGPIPAGADGGAEGSDGLALNAAASSVIVPDFASPPSPARKARTRDRSNRVSVAGAGSLAHSSTARSASP